MTQSAWILTAFNDAGGEDGGDDQRHRAGDQNRARQGKGKLAEQGTR